MNTPHHLIDRYWENVRARGDTPKPVYAIISTGGEQPIGYCLGWSINKRESERRSSERGDCRIEKITP